MRKIFLLLALPALVFGQRWNAGAVGNSASLRGVSARSSQDVWVSGTGGSIFHFDGTTWRPSHIPKTESLDFRGIVALSAHVVLVMSSGEGSVSRVYRTIDDGASWNLVLANPDRKGFFDSLAFWDLKNGILLGDPVDGRFAIFTTDDGGATWARRPGGAALPGEGAFAASNSAMIVGGKDIAWFGSGGVGAARLFRSADAGKSWAVFPTGMRNDEAGSGIFSLAWFGDNEIIAVGGNFSKPLEQERNVAIIRGEGGARRKPTARPSGYKSAVVWLPGPKILIATGPNGSEISYHES